MALAQYTDTFWFPNGSPAVNIAATVFPRNSSIPATLYTDGTGSTTLPNPTPTSAAGLLSFWAESGEYWIHLDTEAFLVTVGMSQEQADLSTGIASGGELNANLLNPSALDITAMDGYIVDYLAGTQAEPVITRVKTPAQTVALDAGALARTVTWWLIDSGGNVIQQAAKPDAAQRRTHIMLGVTAQVGGAIIVDQSLPVILGQQAGQFVDLAESLGSFSISGNVIAPNGANLMINQTSGELFARAFGHSINGVQTDSPHIVTTQAQTPADFIRITQTTTTAPALTNILDVANYDVAGVVTPIGGGVNRSSVHRVYLFPNNDPQRQIIIHYGQTAYANLDAAQTAIGTEPFIENPAFIQGGGTLVGFIAATRTATDLSDTTQARFIRAAKFGGGPAGSASSGGGTAHRSTVTRITDGAIADLPSAAAWTIAVTSVGTPLQGSIQAVANDRIRIEADFMRNGAHFLDWALLDSAGVPSVYGTTRTSTPPAEGSPSMYPSTSFSYVQGGKQFTVAASHISAGLVTIALTHQGTSPGRVFAHTTYPFEITLTNLGPEPA